MAGRSKKTQQASRYWKKGDGKLNWSATGILAIFTFGADTLGCNMENLGSQNTATL